MSWRLIVVYLFNTGLVLSMSSTGSDHFDHLVLNTPHHLAARPATQLSGMPTSCAICQRAVQVGGDADLTGC